MSQTVRLPAKGDSTVRADFPNRVVNNKRLGLKGNAPQQRALLHFNLKSLPTDAVVLTATLLLNLRGTAWSGTNTVTAKRVTSKWAERRVTWNNQPTVSATNAGSEVVSSGSDGDPLEIDVTDLVNDAVALGKVWHGIRLEVDTSGAKFLHSSEAKKFSFRPRLLIEYSTPPPAPSRLAPRGGDAVNATKPKLAWEAEEQSELQVQVLVNPADPTDFSAPDYDSGFVASTDRGWDLNLATSPTFSALSTGDDVWWRVRIKNIDGLQSPWSAARHFIREPYGTLTITDPASDGDGVDSLLPTITTTFTGQTQERIGWQVLRRSVGDDRWVRTARDAFTDGVATTASDFELALGAIDEPDATYAVVVRVWDDQDRGSAVGEKPYVQVQRTFIYDPAAGTDAAASLTATQMSNFSPGIQLEWTRSTNADSFDIWMDGKVIAQNIDDADVEVTSGNYRYDVWHAIPHEEHVFTVVATVGGVDSVDSPEVTITSNVRGIWLCLPDENFALVIYDRQNAVMGLGEVGTTFEPLGRQSVVRIVDTVRGLEGTVSGKFATDNEITSRTWRRRLLELKEQGSEANVRLVLDRLNFPVVVGEVELPPLPLVDEMYEVSVQFWQVGEFEVDW